LGEQRSEIGDQPASLGSYAAPGRSEYRRTQRLEDYKTPRSERS
jgi:hypothetical protein